jgi:L-Ala-D/L-Glu epimerase
MDMDITIHRYPARAPARIAGRADIEASAVRVTLTDGTASGRGEGVGVIYLGESAGSMVQLLEAVRSQIESGASRAEAQNLLPPGGARAALDAAYWDLEAKRKARRVWQIAGLSEPKPTVILTTIGFDTPDVMRNEAESAPTGAALKVKLGDARDDRARIAAVKEAAPQSRMIVDANQGWNFEQLVALAPALAAMGVELIEQPLPRGQDEALEHYASPVPLCADESCQSRDDLASLAGRYTMINIKLNKTGGLTEGMALAQEASALGFTYIVGSMLESSLGLAPALLLAQGAAWCDLDGPYYLAHDAEPHLRYEGSIICPPEPELWG